MFDSVASIEWKERYFGHGTLSLLLSESTSKLCTECDRSKSVAEWGKTSKFKRVLKEDGATI